MLTYKEKLAVLSQMIQLSKADGVFHEKELQFIKLIAQDYNVKSEDLNELLEEESQKIIFHSVFQRIEHFYKMALLMQCDKSTSPEELNYIKNMGLKLGLSPTAIDDVIDVMQNSQNNMIEPEKLLEIFKRYDN